MQNSSFLLTGLLDLSFRDLPEALVEPQAISQTAHPWILIYINTMYSCTARARVCTRVYASKVGVKRNQTARRSIVARPRTYREASEDGRLSRTVVPGQEHRVLSSNLECEIVNELVRKITFLVTGGGVYHC